jgi:predicted DNA-binding protein YlxM (UPF0122 family)
MDASVTSSVGDNQQHPDEAARQDDAGAAQLSVALSPKQRVVLEALMLPDASVPAAAEKAGVHRGTVNRWLLRDEHFIAAFNARTLEMVSVGHARMLALVPKALVTIEDAIESGDARIAMQLLKSGVLSPQKTVSLSSTIIADELKVAEQRQQLELRKQQVELEKREEALIVQKKEVKKERNRRIYDDKPFEERYEEDRRWYWQALAEGKAQKARMKEIDARVAAAAENAASGLANPGGKPRQTKASPEANASFNPGTPASS